MFGQLLFGFGKERIGMAARHVENLALFVFTVCTVFNFLNPISHQKNELVIVNNVKTYSDLHYLAENVKFENLKYERSGSQRKFEPVEKVRTYNVLKPSFKSVLVCILLRGGDIQTNPGPVCIQRHSQTPTKSSDEHYQCFSKKGMHFIHLNARSLLPKISELRYLANKTTAAIISVTETWLDSSVTNSEIKIEGYSIVRRDRNRHGGGVCTYIYERYAFTTKGNRTN